MISELMVSDMKQKMDQSQYGNNKGISVQHYLVKMLHKILTQLDNNSGGDTFAVIAALIDWKLDGVGPVDNRPSTDKLHHFLFCFGFYM